MKLSRLTILLVAYSLSGCQYDPRSFEYARTKPTLSLIGKYKLSSQSYRYLEGLHKEGKFSQFELRNDSTFFIKDIAAIWSPFPTVDGFEDVKGKWSLVKHQEWWAVQLDVRSVKQADGHLNLKGFTTQAMLIGQEAPYTLHLGIGDPDTGDALQYQRQ